MSRIGSSTQSVLLREISNNRIQMDDLSRQLSSGKVADSYGGLGSGRTMSLALRQEMKEIESFKDTITLASTRLKVSSKAVEHMRDQALELRGQLVVGGFEIQDSGQTLAQTQSRARLSEVVELLNTEVGGRHLFAGAKTDDAPVRPPSELLNGLGGKAGFNQIMDERMQADLGAGDKGRLVLAQDGLGGVTLSEDMAGSPFGFKLAAITSNMAGTNITGPAGVPEEVGVEFTATPPVDGEQITVLLDLPDGSQTELVLTARASGPLEEGEFAIGANAAARATGFEDALSALVTSEAKTSLSAASMQAAADDFFTSGADKAQRVDGPPFDSAGALRDATDSDTVVWYTGDRSSTPARETSLARVDNNQLVAYGAKADEKAFSGLVKQMAIMSSAQFDPAVASDRDKYQAMTERVAGHLGSSMKDESIDRVIGEMAIAQSSLGKANERHIASDDMVTNFLAEIETADINEVGSRLLSLQTQLQASYQVTSMLSKLSLANYI